MIIFTYPSQFINLIAVMLLKLPEYEKNFIADVVV